jgi:hypothetical protein
MIFDSNVLEIVTDSKLGVEEPLPVSKRTDRESFEGFLKRQTQCVQIVHVVLSNSKGGSL